MVGGGIRAGVVACVCSFSFDGPSEPRQFPVAIIDARNVFA